MNPACAPDYVVTIGHAARGFWWFVFCAGFVWGDVLRRRSKHQR